MHDCDYSNSNCEICKKEMKKYRIRALPAQVQLAERMRNRGTRVDPGERLEYIVTTNGGLKARQFDKIEDPKYQQEFSDIIKIDFIYYLHLLINPLDQVLKVAYKEDKFMDKQYKLRIKKYGINRRIEELFSPNIKISEKK